MNVPKRLRMKNVTFIKIDRSTKDMLKVLKTPSSSTYNAIIKKLMRGD